MSCIPYIYTQHDGVGDTYSYVSYIFDKRGTKLSYMAQGRFRYC